MYHLGNRAATGCCHDCDRHGGKGYEERHSLGAHLIPLLGHRAARPNGHDSTRLRCIGYGYHEATGTRSPGRPHRNLRCAARTGDARVGWSGVGRYHVLRVLFEQRR